MARVNLKGKDSAAVHEPHTLYISVAHGDLRRARYPLAIGHYHGDTIVHAERRLDQQLNGRLTELFNLYLYPGPKETAEVILVPHAKPPGALVIGLGDVGEIQPSTVRDGVANAALRHALAVLNEARNRGDGRSEDVPGAPISTGFSTLLLGTYGGNSLSVEASLTAIIQGVVRANEALRSVRTGQPPRTRLLWDLVRINEVQFVELYEDVALTAARAAVYLESHPPANFPEGDTLKFVPTYIDPLGNGRFQRPSDPYTGGWWRRIRITSEKLKDGGEGLSFLALTDRARAEDTIQYTQRGFIEELVRRAVESAAGADELATVLFKLLIPNSIKDQTRSEADLLLVLDAAAAQYPWELLAERTRDNKPDPIALRMGIIRQFQTKDFIENPQPARGRNALVIGEPKTNNQVPLPGARAEAEAVAEVLQKHNYDVGAGALVNAGSIELLNRLFEKGYKIIHLAGHGEYVKENPAASGMLLDNGVLSSITLRNLSPLPELVFINCCHLGKLDEPRLRTDSPHALAASVSEELIKMGVKAVVAAGWAVEDKAAAAFARTFYDEMLRGQKFGAAVKEARRAAEKTTPNSNTWGAYQCYGNPDFVLSSEGDSSESAGKQENRCYTRSGYLERFADIASDASRAEDRQRIDALCEALSELSENLPERWRDGEVLSALGQAWGALRNYEQAIAFYSKARAHKEGRASLKSFEQLANMRVKLAQTLKDPKRAFELIDESIKDLKQLLKFGPTSERLSLLGGSYKRKAIIAEEPDEKVKWLSEARKYYGQAHSAKRKERDGEIDPYSAINWLTYRILLGEPIEPDLGLIEECKAVTKAAIARKIEKRESTFWDQVHEADAELVRHLALGDLEKNLSEQAAHYRRAFSAGSSPDERASVTDQFTFLHDMLAAVGKGDDKTQSNLRSLRRLSEEFASAA